MAFVNFGKERDAVSRPQTTQWLGVAGSVLHRKVCKGGDFWQDPRRAMRYKAQNFERYPLLVCQRWCGDLVE
jgi:hypothetical protein